MSHHAGNQAAWGTALALATLLAAGSAAAGGYDKTFQNEFMGNCITGGGMYTVCQCTLLQIQSQIKYETFAEMQKAVRALWIARSIESTIATPSATPRTEKRSCDRWWRKYRVLDLVSSLNGSPPRAYRDPSA